MRVGTSPEPPIFSRTPRIYSREVSAMSRQRRGACAVVWLGEVLVKEPPVCSKKRKRIGRDNSRPCLAAVLCRRTNCKQARGDSVQMAIGLLGNSAWQASAFSCGQTSGRTRLSRCLAESLECWNFAIPAATSARPSGIHLHDSHARSRTTRRTFVALSALGQNRKMHQGRFAGRLHDGFGCHATAWRVVK